MLLIYVIIVVVVSKDVIEINGKKYKVEENTKIICPCCQKEYGSLLDNGLCLWCDRAFNAHLHHKIYNLEEKIRDLDKDRCNLEKENTDLKSKIYLFCLYCLGSLLVVVLSLL